MKTLHPAYFETQFETFVTPTGWPPAFAIVTACPTTGETWTNEQIIEAQERLETELRESGRWFQPITGISPDGNHAEPGWAVELPFEDACRMGQRHRQDAIYFVEVDTLYVSLCRDPNSRTKVGEFRARVAAPTPGAEGSR